MSAMNWILLLVLLLTILVVVALWDLFQTRNPIRRNFPIAGHGRGLLNSAGPKLRQYIVASNNEELPFTRDQRRWVYDSAQKRSAYFGFGTDSVIDRNSHIIIKHSAFPDESPIDELATIPCAKVMGALHNRPKAFRPDSIVYVSAMSYGSLSAQAVESINRGCEMANALHNTGEGGISEFHRNGAGLIFQVGTGYFGARNPDGTLNIDLLAKTAESANVKAIEIKLSQGAKPGLGGVLPGSKVTPQIAAARGVPEGVSVLSPNRHSAFSNIEELIDVIEAIAAKTGLCVGIKSAVGQIDFWYDLAEAMSRRNQGPDFITIDGGEGGTGAAPLAFSDHVSLPWRQGFVRAIRPFVERGLDRGVVFLGSGRLGFPQDSLAAMALGADMIGVAREAMLSIGCIQAQRCHDGHCPTGIATHNRWLTHGLVPDKKSVNCANYLISLRSEILKLAHACGVPHPALVSSDMLECFDKPHKSATLEELFGLSADMNLDVRNAAAIREVMVNLQK